MAIATKRSLEFRLSNPGYTIYHRAALGGLAATIRAWKRSSSVPQDLTCHMTSDTVRIDWTDCITEKEALRRLLAGSFEITDDGLIDLPGHQIAGRDDLRVILHNSITQTFLQHPKMRPGPKETKTLILKTADDDGELIVTYKPVGRYAHQVAQGTGLLDEKGDCLPEIATIPQSVIPGAFTGSRQLDCPSDEAILLIFLMVGCSIFQLRPRNQESKFQTCIVVPDVIDLEAFARCTEAINQQNSNVRMRINSALGRVVGSAEEAAFRFLLDFFVAENTFAERPCIAGCQAIAMGKVAWDANQVNRSTSIKLGREYKEIAIFEAADEYWRKRRILQTKKGESFIIPQSHVPELIAVNLANGHHWCRNFLSLVADKKKMHQLLFQKEGLARMNDSIRDEDDLAIINAFHEAWRRTMAAIYERAQRDGLNSERLIEVERERTRNAILRMKSTEMLAGWFLRFCADATNGGSLKAIRNDAERIRKFIFSPRNFERFQNLCLFALVSYESSKTPSATGASI